jgi:hypothetical protein
MFLCGLEDKKISSQWGRSIWWSELVFLVILSDITTTITLE